MSYKEVEKCPECGKEFATDSETYYWHLKTHLAKIELLQQVDLSIIEGEE